MNDLLPDPVTVVAPERCYGWTASGGFIDDVTEYDEARFEGDVVLEVEAGRVDGVEGDAPLAVAVRQDRQLLELHRTVQTLALRLLRIEDRLGA